MVGRSALRVAIALACLVGGASLLRAQPADDDSLPTPQEAERRGAVIGEVTLKLKDIFDPEIPEEDRKLFRAANKLHRQTRPSVVEGLLLFRPGDRFSVRKVEESERMLREAHFFDDPEIRIVRYADGKVDLEVETRDLWTLKGGAGVGRSGGVNSTHFKVEDTNLLGTGKTVELEHSTNVDRTSSVVHYRDRDALGERILFDLSYASNSDGDRKSLVLERPFFSLDSRWAAGLNATSDDRVDSLYELGEISSAFRHEEERFELYGGWSRERELFAGAGPGSGGRVSRFTTGFTFDRNRFAAEPGLTAPGEIPPDHTVSAPWIAYDNVGSDYLKTRNFEQLGRIEDLSIGWRFHARLGASLSAFGADRDEAVFEGSTSWGIRPEAHPSQTLLLSASASGRYGGEGGQNLRAGARARFYWRDFGEQLFLASIEGDVAHNLDPENQLLLGGDSGLRGYPLRYQNGDRRLLVSLEQRFFTHWYPFRLFHVGGAVFFDAGEVWSANEAGEANKRGLLKDIGFGLRLGSTRSSLGSVVHIDIAFPLDGDGSIKNVQYLVTSKAGF